jgi:hypothetical protein
VGRSDSLDPDPEMTSAAAAALFADAYHYGFVFL